MSRADGDDDHPEEVGSEGARRRRAAPPRGLELDRRALVGWTVSVLAAQRAGDLDGFEVWQEVEWAFGPETARVMLGRALDSRTDDDELEHLAQEVVDTALLDMRSRVLDTAEWARGERVTTGEAIAELGLGRLVVPLAVRLFHEELAAQAEWNARNTEPDWAAPMPEHDLDQPDERVA